MHAMTSEGTITLTHRVPPVLADQLKRLALREGTSQNHEMTVALRAHLDADRQRRNAR